MMQGEGREQSKRCEGESAREHGEQASERASKSERARARARERERERERETMKEGDKQMMRDRGNQPQ